MLWDLFCRVVDNFGDIGVCWRLAVDLGQRGQDVRLWVDDAAALQWMAPQVRWEHDQASGLPVGLGQPGVTVMNWADAQRDEAALPGLQSGDVVIEAFGCDPPDAFIARMARRADDGGPPQWINLEYLSAEDYVERSHGLRSPVWSGPGAGLSKRFFYPGFTPATGGLLREPALMALREAEVGLAPMEQAPTDDPAKFGAGLGANGQVDPGAPGGRSDFLRSLGVSAAPQDPLVLVFCYDSAPLAALLDRLEAEAGPAATVLLTPGPATRLGQAWQADRSGGSLALHALPHLPQPDFDRLLWCTDLNFVRGEDSAVRALWAGRPHVWQIYEQDDGVHAAKLDAFMGRWMAAWPDALRQEVMAWWRGWNQLGPMPEALPAWRGPQAAWRRASQDARAALWAQRDLCTQLLEFVASSG